MVKTESKVAPVEEVIAKRFVPAVPWTAKLAMGEEVLIPTLPLVRTVNIESAAAVEDTIEKGFSVPAPCTNNLANGVEVPIPTLPLAKALKMFAVWMEETSKMEEVAPVDEANTDSAPLDMIPPAPTFKPVPAIIFPWAKMSFLDWILPTSAL